MSTKEEKPPKTRAKATVDGSEPASPEAPPSSANFERLGQRIADLSHELAQITQLSGAAPRKIEVDAAAAAFKSLADAYASEPTAYSDAQLDLLGRHSDALQRMAEGQAAPEADADARFSDPAWRENPFYDFVRRIFLTTAEWTENFAKNAPGLSDLERRRAAFFMRQAAAAMAPSNLLGANPRALKAMFDSEGASIQRGFANLQADFNAGRGRISVTQSDPQAFVLGENLAITPGEIVLTTPLIELIRYFPTTTSVKASPLLIFPPWINKYYVLDLTPANSLVAWLRDQGFTVYIVSWRSADAEISAYDWDDYVRLGGRAALDWVHAAHQAPINAAGYCVGGVLLSVLAARLAAEGDERLASISLLAAQTDFSEPGDLGLFVDEAALGGLAELIEDSGGVMPGDAMRDAFNLLRPEDLIWRYVEERYLLGEPSKPFDLLYWNSDQTNLPGPLHLASLKRLYLDNALAKAEFVVEGQSVELGAIQTPVFLHAARKDHISPFASVYRGVHLFGGEVDFLLADSGHIAGVVNPPAAGKYRYWTNDAKAATPEAWLADAAEQPGSWWPVWAQWLAARAGGDVAPPQPTPGATAAPGIYVRETLASIARKQAGAAARPAPVKAPRPKAPRPPQDPKPD